MKKTEAVQKFWQEFCETTSLDPETPFQVWFFGNSPEMARELADLVVSGKKTATASLASVNEIKPKIAPISNGYSVVTNFENDPLCIIQTTEINHLPFDEVDANFAFDEGEGDRTLEYWREVHRRYFTKEAAELNLEFNEKSLVCCERFRVLFLK